MFFKKKQPYSKANAKYKKSKLINNIKFILKESSYKAVCYYVLNSKDFESLNNIVRNLTSITEDITFIIYKDLFCINLDLKIEENIEELEEKYFKAIEKYCNRATEKEILKDAFSSCFPTFTESDKIPNTIDEINQTVEDQFGYFILNNNSAGKYRFEEKPVYGTVLKLIYQNAVNTNISAAFDKFDVIDVIHCLPKKYNELHLKKIRAQYKYEAEMFSQTNDDFCVNHLSKKINLADQALNDLDNGEIICEFNKYVVLYADTHEELKEKTKQVVTYFKDIDVLACKSLVQALDYFYTYIHKLSKEKLINYAVVKFPIGLISPPKEIEEIKTTEETNEIENKIETYFCTFCGTMYKGNVKGFMPACPNCGGRNFKEDK